MIRFSLAALAALGLPAALSGQEAPLVFRDVRVFDGEAVRERVTVVVEEGRIVALGEDPAVPAGATIVEGAGRTLLPGLIDAHTHTFDPAGLLQAAVFGVTTHLDQVTDLAFAARMREAPPAGGAGLFSAGPPITVAGGHGTQFGLDFEPVADPASARERVAEFAVAGSDWIKIIREDGHAWGMDWPTLSDSTMAAAIEAAHAAGLLAVVHPGGYDEARLAAEQGADGIVHVAIDRAPEADFGSAFAATGAFAIPTLTVFQGGAPALAEETRLAPWLGRDARASLARWLPHAAGSSYDHAVAGVRALHAAGVPILAGSDAPNPGTTYGASLHRELELLVNAGLSPVEALRAATSTPADAFALEDRGRIAPGRRADLVLVEGDPTADVTATRAIVGVWKAGRAIDREAAREAVAAELAAREAGGAPGPPGSESGWIADFDEGSPSARFGGGWSISTDAMMGGASTAEMTVVEGGADGTPGALEVTGALAAGAPFLFAGAMFFPGPVQMAPANLSAWGGIAFSARGDGRPYAVLVFSQSGGMQPAMEPFEAGPEWSAHEIPWSAFDTDGSDVMGVFFGPGGDPGDFAFRIDQVRLTPR